jgi:hypothetical protein
LPDSSEQTTTRRRHSDETLASVLAALNEIIRTNDVNAKILFQEGGVIKMKGILNAKLNTYNSKVIKYTAHVLNTIYKHKTLHEFYKQNGYKENDFLHHRSINSKSLTSSPQSTLHRPRGDMGQPTHFTTKGKQITRPQRTEEYRMQKMNQSVDNLSRTNGNGVSNKSLDPKKNKFLFSVLRLSHRIMIRMQIYMQRFINLGHNKFNHLIQHHRILGYRSNLFLLKQCQM